MLCARRGIRPMQSRGPPAPSRVRTAEELAAEDAQKKKEAEEQAAAEAQAKAVAEAKAREEAQREELESGFLASMVPPDAPQKEGADASVSATPEAVARDTAQVAFAETSAELLEAMREPFVH